MIYVISHEHTHTDHGMTSNGNHGGNTNKETSAMFMFMDTYLPPRPVSERNTIERRQEVRFICRITRTSLEEHLELEYLQVQQIDLPVTLAMLMGVTIPQQSMGVVIPSLFQEDELEHVRRVNRMQLMQLGTTNTRSHDIYELQQEILRENRPEIHIVSLYQSCENIK